MTKNHKKEKSQYFFVCWCAFFFFTCLWNRNSKRIKNYKMAFPPEKKEWKICVFFFDYSYCSI